MKPRFVLDESSWLDALKRKEFLPAAMDRLVERMEVAFERSEVVRRHADYYEAPIGDDLALYALLFDPDCPVQIDRDLGERFRLALDRVPPFDDSQLSSYDAFFSGADRFAPGVAWAHTLQGQAHAVAVLPLPLDVTICGKLAVQVDGVVRSLHFVADEQGHRAFFRDAVDVENIDHSTFPEIAMSAFPDLAWVEGIWQELKSYRSCFFGVHRATLVHHLAVLNDEGAILFDKHPGGEGVDKELSARGVDASAENGRARSHRPSIVDRTRQYSGSSHVFWWHTKIQWNRGRLHFLHVPFAPGSTRPPYGHVVIGIFKDHCVLPP